MKIRKFILTFSASMMVLLSACSPSARYQVETVPQHQQHVIYQPPNPVIYTRPRPKIFRYIRPRTTVKRYVSTYTPRKSKIRLSKSSRRKRK